MVRKEIQEQPRRSRRLNPTEELEQGQPLPIDIQVEPEEIIQNMVAPFSLTPAQANSGDVLDYTAPA